MARQRFTNRQVAILKACRDFPISTASELMDLISFDRPGQSQTQIRRLADEGLLHSKKTNNRVTYTVTRAGMRALDFVAAIGDNDG